MKFSRNTPQGGFTLIELVVVIVILGILAAFAIPRFVNISTQARASAVQGIAGTLRSGSALAHGLALATPGQAGAAGTVNMEGNAIALVWGYPAASATGILRTLNDPTCCTAAYPSATTATFTAANAPANAATCQVTYTQAASANAPAQIAVDVSDCS
jgi:MSHA pilin protein MshA